MYSFLAKSTYGVLFGSLLLFGITIGSLPARAAGLTSGQVSAILALLSAFNADQGNYRQGTGVA